MKPQNLQQAPQPPKRPSTKPSITGGIFSILALLSAGIASFFAYPNPERTHTEVTTVAGTVDSGPLADIASQSVGAVLSLPFIVGAVVFGLIAIVFTVLRLWKVKLIGLIFSILWLGLAIWAISIAIGALNVNKADPQLSLASEYPSALF